MSNYDGCYVKLSDDPTFWYVENGERVIVEHMYQYGLLPVIVLEPEQLALIPFAGENDEEE